MKSAITAYLWIIIAIFFHLFTPIASGSSQCIVIYADTHANEEVHRRIVDAIVAIRPIAVFHAGDMVEDGSNLLQWEIFNRAVSRICKISKFYPAPGNRDATSSLFFDNFVLPNNERWYSMEIDGIHLVVLDTNSELSKESPQYAWLQDDLRDASGKAGFIIAIFHHPPFNIGPPDEDEKNLKSNVVPLFERYGVDMVFCGHVHAYERNFYNNIYYIVTGGGGAPLHEKVRSRAYNQKYIKACHFCKLSLKGDQLVMQVLDDGLSPIDQLKIKQRRKILD